MKLEAKEVAEIIEMLSFQHLDIRSVTLGVDLTPAIGEGPSAVKETMKRAAEGLSEAVDRVSSRLGIKIVTKRVAVTPVYLFLEGVSRRDPRLGQELGVEIAKALDEAAKELEVDYVGGYAAFVESGFTPGDVALVNSIPEALASTERLAAMVNVASTQAGINLDAVLRMGEVIRETADLTSGRGPARLGTFANAPEGTPFVPGAYHGRGEPDRVINVAVSGPGVIESVVKSLGDSDVRALHDAIKRAAFKISRLGELVGKEVAREMSALFGSVDLSLAPSPVVGDSVGDVLRAMGLDHPGAPGSILALAILTDAVKKGGAMAVSSIGGLSGAFVPVSEDLGLASAVEANALTVYALEAMSAVCSTGLDMLPLPGDVTPDQLASLIGDIAALGVLLNKSLGVRLLPMPGAKPGDVVELGGLLGSSPVMSLGNYSASKLIRRGGVVPPFVTRLSMG